MEVGPKALDDVGIDEHLGANVPINLNFVDADGSKVELHDILRGQRPALLSLNYSDCPMLCNLQLDGLAEGLRGVGLKAGVDFDIVTVSINPNEKLERTRAYRDKYRHALTEEKSAEHKPEGWHFLTGDAKNIEILARSVGFRYVFVPEQNEFAHTAALMVLSPDAQITRYLYGVLFEPRDVRLALVEAADGKVGTTMDRILLYCFHYDATTGRYAPLAANIMRAAGFVTTLVLGGALWLAWRRERKLALKGQPRV